MAKKKTPLSVYILLDKSSSMAGQKWESAIGAINSYIHTLSKEVKDATVTIAAFSSNFSGWNNRGALYNGLALNAKVNNINFDVLRNEVDISSLKDLNTSETSPAGNTPLYDATALLLNMVDAKNAEKAVVIIMTDGEENASTIYNATSIKDRIATCQHRGYEVLFLGQNFDVERVTQSYGLGGNKFINTADSAELTRSMNFYASSTANYGLTGAAIDTTIAKSTTD